MQFGMLKPYEMSRMAEVRVVNRELYQQPSRMPQPHGPLDLRMGATSKTTQCETCGKQLADCVGHFGVVELALPVLHIGYFKTILTILQCMCKECGRVMMYEQDAEKALRQMRRLEGKPLQKTKYVKEVVAKCKQTSKCPRCGAHAGTVKKAGGLKIIHERFKGKKDDGTEGFVKDLKGVFAGNSDYEAVVNKVQNSLSPVEIRDLLSGLTNDECELMGMKPEVGRPEDMVLSQILVPPVCLRPSVMASMSAGSNEDDLTIRIGDIVHVNSIIENALEKGQGLTNVEGMWDFLQLQVASYINSELPSVSAAVRQSLKSRRSSGLCQRLKGKTGRFRGNLSGKRVDFSSRTVISPDPNMAINEVVVPELLAKTLTYPETVCSANKAALAEAVRKGPEVKGGANFLISRRGKQKRDLKYARRDELAAKLQEGDVVERHLRDGDVVLFNRQPSLHKVSIMAHRVRVMPWRTFRFNVCVCSPYNADFDGDEMNLHVPQTEEARAEADILMGVCSNLVTPRSGEPLVAAIQDFITCTYLLTHKDTFMDKAAFCQAVTYFADGTEKVELPPPAIMKPVQLWTGKQIFSVLLNPKGPYGASRAAAKLAIMVNLSTKNKSYSGGSVSEMCPSDGFTVFYRSQLLAGVVDKSIVGSGSKMSLFYVIERDASATDAAWAMKRLAKFSARWLANYGFSIGISDVTPSPALVQRKKLKIQDAYGEVDKLIEQHAEGSLELQAGCSADETLENKITKELSDVRQACGDICLSELRPTNAPLIMTMCGSKGSNINISQMVACVGQQTVSGKRIPDGFLDRTLPMFETNSRIPAAKGFCANSFYSGLNPTEFFFHTMGGREGLVDTAVKTADTGYMQRRLMKALEDLSVQYDMTVRNSGGSVVQFVYGDDSLDPSVMEGSSKPVNFERTYASERIAAAEISRAAGESFLLPTEMLERVREFWQEVDTTKLGQSKKRRTLVSDAFFADMMEFVEDKADAFGDVRVAQGLDRNMHGATSAGAAAESVAGEIAGVMPGQLNAFLKTAFFKYRRSVVEPGTAVGALGAQSIGEPGTQMTLKTFHFAGVASMNITLGVPRIREIINASKNISTPIIRAPLAVEDRKIEMKARAVKAKVERTTLAEVASEMSVRLTNGNADVYIVLDEARISKLYLGVTRESVADAILGAKLKLEKSDIKLSPSEQALSISLERFCDGEDSSTKTMEVIIRLREQLGAIVVSGISSVERVIINKEGEEYSLVIDGENLLEVMGVPGLDALNVTSNNIMEVEKMLGIEAARRTIINEINFTMSSHGMHVDMRHLAMLSDLMVARGAVLGITRFGIGRMKSSALMLASFERSNEILFNSAVSHRVDAVCGVSESIIMGQPVGVGTGAMKLRYRAPEGGEGDFDNDPVGILKRSPLCL